MHRGDRWVLLVLCALFLCGKWPGRQTAMTTAAGERVCGGRSGILEAALLEAWQGGAGEGEEEILLPEPMPLHEVEARYFALLDANPELFDVAYRFGYTAAEGGVTAVRVEYLRTGETECGERGAMQAAFAARVEELLAALPPGVGEYAAARVLHDALAAVVRYGTSTDTDSLLGREGAYTAYGALVDGRAVCRGYAMAYLVLLERVGIDATYVSSEEMGHGWVMARLDGEWLHIDVTWDDADDFGGVTHRSFAKTDAAMLDLGYYGWS